MTYTVRDRQTATVIDEFETLDEAADEVKRFEEEDKANGDSEPNTYEIVLECFFVLEQYKNGEFVVDGLNRFETLEEAEKYGKDEYRHLSEREKREQTIIVCDGYEIYDRTGSGCGNYGKNVNIDLGKEK